VLFFEPLTTMAAVVTLNGPPTALIDQAMPMTIVFTLGMAVLITLLYGRSLTKFFAVLLTSAVLVALLGLNVSAIGLVDIPSGSLAVIAELFGLIVALNAVYVIVYVVLERWAAWITSLQAVS
jgi:nitrate reductase gamma subunit